MFKMEILIVFYSCNSVDYVINLTKFKNVIHYIKE